MSPRAQLAVLIAFIGTITAVLADEPAKAARAPSQTFVQRFATLVTG